MDPDYYYDDEDDLLAGLDSAALIAVALPTGTAIAGLVVGILLGGLFGWTVKDPVVQVQATASIADIGELCAPVVEDVKTKLDLANGRVAALTDAVSAGEREVAELKSAINKRKKNGASLSRQLRRAKEELAQVKLELEEVVAEKERLIDELTETQEVLASTHRKLKKQVKATKRAQDDALTNKWYRFLDESQLEICERGNRKRMGDCRQRVLGILGQDKIRDKFSHCERSGQAVPRVSELGKDESLPAFSYFMNRDDKIVKGWYVHFCDPTLPERGGFDDIDEPLPRFQNLDDDDDFFSSL